MFLKTNTVFTKWKIWFRSNLCLLNMSLAGHRTFRIKYFWLFFSFKPNTKHILSHQNGIIKMQLVVKIINNASSNEICDHLLKHSYVLTQLNFYEMHPKYICLSTPTQTFSLNVQMNIGGRYPSKAKESLGNNPDSP